MSVLDATAAVDSFHSKLQDLAFGFVQERINYDEPLTELTEELVRFLVFDGFHTATLVEQPESDYLRHALDCDPASYALGYVSALLEVSRRVAAGLQGFDGREIQLTAHWACPWASSES